jgi:hypothetical protein
VRASSLFSLTILSYSLLFSSGAKADTSIQFEPMRPARCDQRDYNLVNWVYSIDKLGPETEDEVKFGFQTQYGPCVGRLLSAHPIDTGIVYFETLEDGTHFRLSEPVKVSFKQGATPEVLSVALKFKKNKIFKNAEKDAEGRSIAVFHMKFYPYGLYDTLYGPSNSMFDSFGRRLQYVRYNGSFNWRITLTQNPDGTSKVDVQTISE